MEGPKLNTIEEVRGEIRERIKKAYHNPISVERLSELDERLDRILGRFSEKGERTKSEIETEKEIAREIAKHSVVVYGIAEFRLVLEEVSNIMKDFGGKEDIEDTLAHENAHMVAAAKLGYNIEGYALTFIAREDGVIGVQPSCLITSNEKWTLKETLNNTLTSLNAPREQKNYLSERDIKGIISIRRMLQKLHEKEMA